MRAAILLFCALAAASCGTAAVAAERATPLPAPVAAIAPRQAELRLDVVELTCHSCAGQVAEGTARIPGVLHVSAEMLDHMLIVSYDPTRLTESALISAIDKVVDAVAD
ncbi:MAG TPA: heavy-metal-associated domain-containing protein [Candidatus Limnocylindria bacterium]|nr:heavy-metal-associated domain-containing protein [Candidatus Limnocylindria bacterium]